MLGIDSPKFAPETWLSDVSDDASHYGKRAEWSKTWFARFFTAGSDEKAFAAFGLLLECVDRRFWVWKDDVQATASTSFSARRSAFLAQSLVLFRKALRRMKNPCSRNSLVPK
jgi:hypothetical protein